MVTWYDAAAGRGKRVKKYCRSLDGSLARWAEGYFMETPTCAPSPASASRPARYVRHMSEAFHDTC